MVRIRPLRKVLGWACLLIPAFLYPGDAFGAAAPSSTLEPGMLSRVVSVKAKTAEMETLVTVNGNGIIAEYEAQTFAEPPRIVVDLLCASQGFETESISLACPILKMVRIGRHPDRIRIVLDVKGLPIPAFSLKREKTSLHITVSHDTRDKPGAPDKVVEGPASYGPEDKPAERRSSEPASGADDGSEGMRSAESTLEELLDIDSPDGQADTLLLQEGIRAFRGQIWIKAAEIFRALQEKNPQGRYGERASLLLAKSYERLKEDDLSTHFADIRNLYEIFLSRFPTSKYGGEALGAIGRLCFQIGHYAEAMGYYGLAFSRDKNSPAAVEALVGQMKIHMLKKRFDEALSVSSYILAHHPQCSKAMDVKLDTARILYELNQFQESLSVLSDLQRDGVRNAYFHPEISLYLGYNGCQLGNYTMARENLFRFYNVSPGAEEIPLVLTKIGDTYRDEKSFDAASKVYRWVAESYPDSEGALISQIRLAELQEQGRRTAQEKGIGFGAQPGDAIPSPGEVYEAMLQNAKFKDGKNPLIALALLKLAVFYEKEGEYGNSLAMVKELLERFPGQQLQKEAKHVLLKTLQGTLKEGIRAKDYYTAIRFYYEEKDLFQMVDSPELYMAIARVFLEINLRDDAASLFRKAGPLLLDDEKPSDLLYFLALDLYREKRSDQALDKLRAAVGKGQDSESLSAAYRLMGRIMVERMQWEKAFEAFDGALDHSSGPCIRMETLTEKASAQEARGMKEAALASAKKAGGLIAECGSSSRFVYENLSGVFSRLGRPEEALAILMEAAGKEDMEKEQERIRWKIAQTYESLGQKEESLSAYRHLAGLADPLWRALANEKIEEIRFRQKVDSLKRE